MSSSIEVLPGAVAPILSADLLSRIHRLNEDYLELLVSQRRCAHRGSITYLPDAVIDALCAASAQARQTIATTAFSLYSLGFEDQTFWRHALWSHEEPLGDRYKVSDGETVQSAFCEVALLHAWHIAVTQPIAARLVHGMPSSIVERIAHASLWQLRRIAIDHSELLVPRWPTNPCFWVDSIKFASAGDLRRLHTVQQLGHQLIAVDLQTSGEKHSAVRDRQRNLLKQRLRRTGSR